MAPGAGDRSSDSGVNRRRRAVTVTRTPRPVTSGRVRSDDDSSPASISELRKAAAGPQLSECHRAVPVSRSPRRSLGGSERPGPRPGPACHESLSHAA
eukprot:701655-Hanusia_phi.AAC.1